MEEIVLCRSQGVVVVIDNAAGLGAPRTPSELGGNVFEVFSMHATKPFGVGEGGAILAYRSHDSALREALDFAPSFLPKRPSRSLGALTGRCQISCGGLLGADLLGLKGCAQTPGLAPLYLDRSRDFPAPNPSIQRAPELAFFPVPLPDPTIAAISFDARLKSEWKSGATIARAYPVGPAPKAAGFALSRRISRIAWSCCP